MNVLLHLLYYISIHLVISHMEHLFTCFLVIYISFGGKCMFKFLNWIENIHPFYLYISNVYNRA